MANPYQIKLDDHSLRWAAAEGVPESVIAAICLLHEKSVDEIVAKLSPTELEQAINIVGRSPSCYPPGVYAALKGKRNLASLQPAPTPNVARQQAKPPQNAAASPQNRAHCQYKPNPEMMVVTPPAVRSAAAERMRQHRERRRQGLRCLTIEFLAEFGMKNFKNLRVGSGVGAEPPSLLLGAPGRGRCSPSAILKSSADCASTERVRRHHLDRRIAPGHGL
jgi:hypothetical protein